MKDPQGKKVQIDHTVVRRAWKNSVTNISTDHSAVLNSNHRLVVTKLTVKKGK